MGSLLQRTTSSGQTGRGEVTPLNINFKERCFHRSKVQGADKMTGIRQPPVPYTLAHLGKPYDLVNVPEECPNLTNTCQVN